VAALRVISTTREGMTIATRKQNGAANSPKYRLSAAPLPPPLRHKGILSRSAKEYNVGRSTIHCVIHRIYPDQRWRP
jgi:hypothetical protein